MMDNKTVKENSMKVSSGIHAGIWFTMGVGMGSVQVVPSKEVVNFTAPTGSQIQQQPKIVA